MKTRILSALSLIVLLFSSTGAVLSKPGPKRSPARQTNPLLLQLPESDSVALIDSRRFFDDALPKLLATKQSILTKIIGELDEIQRRTSIDLRKFDHLALGVNIVKVSPKDFGCDPVLLARGTFNAGALVGVTKLAADGTYREEKLSGHTIYIFSVKDVAAKQAAKSAGSGVANAIENTADNLTHEVAVTSLNANTLAIGSLNRIKETIEGKTRVSPDLLGLLTPYDRSVISFAVRTPDGLSQFIAMDNDELGKTLGSIRYLAGSIDVTPAATSAQLLARAASADQAQGVLDTVQGAQQLGSALLGNSKRDDYKVLARLVQNAKIAKTGADVTVDISIPQSDINILLATLKK
jgi:hypothetical protein